MGSARICVLDLESVSCSRMKRDAQDCAATAGTKLLTKRKKNEKEKHRLFNYTRCFFFQLSQGGI